MGWGLLGATPKHSGRRSREAGNLTRKMGLVSVTVCDGDIGERPTHVSQSGITEHRIEPMQLEPVLGWDASVLGKATPERSGSQSHRTGQGSYARKAPPLADRVTREAAQRRLLL